MRAPQRREDREYLDLPGQAPRELEALVREIGRANARFGGVRLVLRYLEQFVTRIPAHPITLLDVATGGADIPRAVAAWARRRGLEMRITAADIHAGVLAIAREEVRDWPEITLTYADALALPFPDRSFDVVTCGLALHHFTSQSATRVLDEVARTAREGFVVHDLVRSWGAYLGVWIQTRLLGRSRLARHDGPLSVQRSFTIAELRRLTALSRIPDVELRTHPMFRVALVRRPGGAPA